MSEGLSAIVSIRDEPAFDEDIFDRIDGKIQPWISI